MPTYDTAINQHYGQDDLGANILAALARAGKDVNALTRDDLALFDELHTGGRDATRTLAQFAKLRDGMHVLDVGSGVGGPARTLAAEFGCRVTGVDLTEAFCRAAEMLTERVGLSHRVTFRPGNALDLPFDEASFDVVWTQNALMNIADKGRFCRQAYRVLRPGGRLVMAALMAGPVAGIHLPVFWASHAALNFLVPPEEFRQLVVTSGFAELAWEDVTQQAIAMSRRRRMVTQRAGVPELGVQLIVADDVPEKMANGVRNYEEGRVVAIRALFERPA
jgi:SAM-dependent methyltransferase